MAPTSPRPELEFESPPLSPHSSTTAYSSPTHSRRTSLSFTTKILGFPSKLFGSPNMDDVEKASGSSYPASPSMGGVATAGQQGGGGSYFGQSHGHPHGTTIPHIGLRRRRLLAQALVVLGVLSMGGWMLLGERELSEVFEGLRGTKLDTASTHDYYGIVEPPIPGITLGANGEVFDPASPPVAEAIATAAHPPPKAAEWAQIQPQPWGHSLSSSRLLNGLRTWPSNPPYDEETPALSSLGHFADNIYNVGPLTMVEYKEQLEEFVRNAFPEKVADQLKEGLNRYLNGDEGRGNRRWDEKKIIWQTDKDKSRQDNEEVKSWRDGKARDEGWKWDLMTDAEADKWAKKKLAGSKMFEVWENLPSGILRSDTLRYLLLLLEGGIYTDTDTDLLKPPSQWGQGARLFRNGAGWVTDEQRERLDKGEDVDKVLGKPSVVVGVEADVGDREDWFDWWPRPMQIVQWTMASAPDHPIALQACLRILHSTATAIDWAHENKRIINILKDQGRYEDAKDLASVGILNEPKNGGPVGVMAWTGPGVWTDAVLGYLRVKYGLLWTDLRGIQEPLRIGDVVILPVTGFSPGVGNFGSQLPWHDEAMVEHRFAGSWKNGQ
ncbi:hypothetical protein CI109_105012 [Kwoniella shandongensis]|uniref:Uncharacterized protein n=1 Tax=Kwoniella shandongensis TaxID=1734106 RepID=A0A5M6BYM5_9TREE|nr:uncharacterized protein CI109_004391 [Kwoniella shandongensis]KAA5527330.1 hypothetical protein CI109_004391 [Kwoniella shandongensis]